MAQFRHTPQTKKAYRLGKPLSYLARPERFELPAFWFVGALVNFEVLCFQQVRRPALTRNLHKGALSGTKCYVFATFARADKKFNLSKVVSGRAIPTRQGV